MDPSAKNSSPAVAPEAENNDEFRSCILIVGPVGLWTTEVNDLIQKSLPRAKLLACPDEQEVARHLDQFDLIMIFCQAKVDSELQRCSQVIKTAMRGIKIGSMVVNLVTGNTDHPNLKVLEQQRLITVIKSNINPKALRVKVDYSFARMQKALEAHRKSYPEFYIKYGDTAAGPGDQRIGLEDLGNGDERIAGDRAKLSPLMLDPNDFESESPVATVRTAAPDGAKATRSSAELTAKPERSITDTSTKPTRTLALVEPEPEPETAREEWERITAGEDVYKQFVLISSRTSDLDFVASISRNVGSNFHVFANVSPDIHRFLSRYPDSIIFWDVDHEGAVDPRKPDSAQNVGLMLSRTVLPPHVFALSDKTVNKLPYLYNFGRQVFVHNILRRNNAPAIEIYSRLVECVSGEQRRGSDGFFIGGSRKQEIRLIEASHRAAAIGATKNFLLKQGLTPRLANQVAQESDELLLNAIYHAPVNAEGERYRQSMDRSVDFKLSPKEQISLAVMSNDSYVGVSVRDQFGSLKIDNLLTTLYRDHSLESPEPEQDQGAGIGLSKVLESGFSLLLTSIAGEATEATLFFPKVKTHKEFKKNFRFLSMMWFDKD